MADDTVTSLRSSAEWIKDLEHEMWFGTAEPQITAADAIERLQAADDVLAKVSALVLCDCDNKDCTALRDAVKAWQEARRG